MTDEDYIVILRTLEEAMDREECRIRRAEIRLALRNLINEILGE